MQTEAKTQETYQPPPDNALDAVLDLLPPRIVNVRFDGVTMQMSRYMMRLFIREAISLEHSIDRSNGDGPLTDWDGWLVVNTPELPHYVETDPKKRHKLARPTNKKPLPIFTGRGYHDNGKPLLTCR